MLNGRRVKPETEPLTQPGLHELVGCLAAPTAALGQRDGQLRPEGAQGVFCGDVRVLSRAELRVGPTAAEPLGWGYAGPGAARFVSLLPGLALGSVDRTVRLDRTRRVSASGLAEEVQLRSWAAEPVRVELTLRVESDLAELAGVKSGAPAPPPRPPAVHADRLEWRSAGGMRICLRAPGAALSRDGAVGVLSWSVLAAPRSSTVLGWSVEVEHVASPVRRPAGGPPWAVPHLEADDDRLPLLVSQSLADLDTLRLELSDQPGQQFLGAGSPWYLALFGRDSLWAARMLLPLGTELAASTLGVLAARQGRRHDPGTAEAPGKIMHELRPGAFPAGGPAARPAGYYGTVDATPLWVLLLHDAWRWGLAEDRVAALLPNLTAALDWLTTEADADGDGLLEYFDPTGHGLANQGWKDSGDAVRFRDGSQALPPIALAEVQGYAYEAAHAGAALCAAFGRPGAERLLDWAAQLAARFRRTFWVCDEVGRYPALALDRAKRPVDAATSNMAHLLGTGLLDRDEAAAVAHRLAAPDLASGFGIRTMASSSAGFSPLSYHCGSIWPHDTAIAIRGLTREGFRAQAAGLVHGLLAAGAAFDGRLPELFAGDSAADRPAPLPYPAACQPQAWTAAAAVSILVDLLGLTADLPAGRLGIDPAPGPVGGLRLHGLQAGGGRLDVTVDRGGRVLQASAGAPGLTLDLPRDAGGSGPPPTAIL